MKRRKFPWIYLSGFVLVILLGDLIEYQVFGASSRVGMLIFTGYSAGLILTSFGIVCEFWWPRHYALERIDALEKKIARLTAAAAVALPAGQTEFTVTLTDYPVYKKITVIKVIREITGLSLKEAKDLVEDVPSTVKQGISKADVELIMSKLAKTGAEVEVK